MARKSLFPIEYHNLWSRYKEMVALHWESHEIPYGKDKKYFDSLDENTQKYIKMVLAFFSQSESIVNVNLATRFFEDIQIEEARSFYARQLANEAIHGETYSTLIQSYVDDEKERELLFNAVDNFPSISEKYKWAMKWLKKKDPFAKRLIAFMCVEGIFFQGSFCAIYWLRNYHPSLEALINANDYIARDESLHCSFAIEVYKTLCASSNPDELLSTKSGGFTKLSQEEVEEIVKEVVELEKKFVEESLPVRLIGIDSSKVWTYIESIADYWVTQLGYRPIYGSKDPFGFMKDLGLSRKENQFENKATSYTKTTDSTKLSFDEDI